MSTGVTVAGGAERFVSIGGTITALALMVSTRSWSPRWGRALSDVQRGLRMKARTRVDKPPSRSRCRDRLLIELTTCASGTDLRPTPPRRDALEHIARTREVRVL